METAISIAHTCRLLNHSMAIVTVRDSDLGSGHGPPATAQPPLGAGTAVAAHSSSAVGRSLAALQSAVASGRLRPSCQPAAAAIAAAGAAAGAAGAASGVGLVIDGAALALVLQPGHELEFLELCKSCAAVVCCRVSPMQKAQVRGWWLTLNAGGLAAWC